jgi:hypothetical protein
MGILSPLGSWQYQGLSLREAQAIAQSVVGAVSWNGAEGFCQCPGAGQHTTRSTATDCKVVCAPAEKPEGTLNPGIYCFHCSCRGAVEVASFLLRSALGKRAPVQPWRYFPPARPPAPRPKPPEFDLFKLKKIAAKLDGIDAAWLAARSPIRPDNRTPASFLHVLYLPREKVLIFDVFESQGQDIWTHGGLPYDARELDGFRSGKPCGVWFLANPIDGEFRINDNGRQSRRSAANVTSWRYLLVESDHAEPFAWLSALAQMPLPISAIYMSGGRSVHALVRVDAESKRHWDEIASDLKPALIVLGADPKAMSAVRLSRLPCCERLGTTDTHGIYHPFPGGPRMQRLLYLDPVPNSVPICERKEFTT